MIHVCYRRFASRYASGDQDAKDFIVLFAASKLINQSLDPRTILDDNQKLACLSVRLALDYNPLIPDTYVVLDAWLQELTQVERHMRICLQADTNQGHFKTIAPAEPLLATGARLVMNSTAFNPSYALQRVLQQPFIERGTRGEACVELLMCLASDRASEGGQVYSVVDFLENLFRTLPGRSTSPDNWKQATSSVIHPLFRDQWEDVSLSNVMKGAKMNFSYFVRLEDYRCINRNFLWRLMIRGAAAICPQGNSGVDGVAPLIFWDGKLGRWSIGAII